MRLRVRLLIRRLLGIGWCPVCGNPTRRWGRGGTFIRSDGVVIPTCRYHPGEHVEVKYGRPGMFPTTGFAVIHAGERIAPDDWRKR